jgi:branched-chain amino acid aminotransferase
MDIQITTISPDQKKTIPRDGSALGFGRHFTDHMFFMNYSSKDGWHNPRIEPHQPLTLDPACMVLHYGQQVFEGLKAYRGADGGVYLFRHAYNFERMNRSCQRMVIPTLDTDTAIAGLKELIRLDQDWIPTDDGCSLYIRPTIIATDPFLGVRPSDTYLFYILAGPVGAYYPEGFNPISIYVSDRYVRAVSGGTGEAKTSGNYAGSLAAQMEAKQAGYSQVLWLDAQERKYIEEVGTMNIFFKIGDKLITSPLTGSILPGNTRAAVIHLAKEWGTPVVERKLSIDEVVETAKSGELQEVFGCGTAAIIAPVKQLSYQDQEYQVGTGETGELAGKLYRYILDIQYAKLDDPYGWREKIA